MRLEGKGMEVDRWFFTSMASAILWATHVLDVSPLRYRHKAFAPARLPYAYPLIGDRASLNKWFIRYRLQKAQVAVDHIL